MKILKIFTLLFVAALLLACSFTVNVPTIKTGLEQTLTIKEPAQAGAQVSRVNIEMGAGTLNLTGGTDQLVEGTVVYNVEAWKPVVTRDVNSVTLSQKTTSSITIPQGDYKNVWELKLGPMPLELSLSTGAYEGKLELGGLSITSLKISDGASTSTVSFSQPNAVTMSNFNYNTGASSVHLEGLGNAHVSSLDFNGGVGAYTLDFSGENSTDSTVVIHSGMSDITIIIPANARAAIAISGELSNVNATGTWTLENSVYHAGTEGALINITVEASVGNLNIVHQ